MCGHRYHVGFPLRLLSIIGTKSTHRVYREKLKPREGKMEPTGSQSMSLS